MGLVVEDSTVPECFEQTRNEITAEQGRGPLGKTHAAWGSAGVLGGSDGGHTSVLQEVMFCNGSSSGFGSPTWVRAPPALSQQGPHAGSRQAPPAVRPEREA